MLQMHGGMLERLTYLTMAVNLCIFSNPRMNASWRHLGLYQH
jgi:hypothetical protein